METSIISLLLVLWLKSLLNWLVVVVQRHYMIRTFCGYFCFSLALIDSLLSFVLTAIFYLEDFSISGWHFTRYHICLLAQIACFVYALLHWPVFLLTGLDNFWTLSASSTQTSWRQKLTYIAGVCLVWMLAILYVFWVFDVVLLGEKCEMLSTSQSSQVLFAVLLTSTCVVLYSLFPIEKWRVEVFLHFPKQCCLVCLRRAMLAFLSTWASFLVLMIVSQLLNIEMHAHLQMNVIWLCFLNSFSVALTLCGRSFTSNSKKSETITDGFCSWYFCFTYGADERNYGQQTSDRNYIKTLNI